MSRVPLSQTMPLVVLAGPTAVGKTALSLLLAQALKAEIVNIDSRQVYQQMDIGTAKPTPDERRQVLHHLLDLFPPSHVSSAAEFARIAQATLAGLQQRGTQPLLVAGSGLYLRALLYGLMPAPAAQPGVRQELLDYAERHGTPALHQRLAHLDPLAAQQYHPHDRVRLVRALEIITVTGETLSLQHQRHQAQRPLYPYIGFGLTRPRAELYARIDARTDAMLASGWLQEVETLCARGYGREHPAMNSLGYRELLAYLGEQTPWDVTVATIKRATRRFAKRQLTWFRKFPGLHWLNLAGQADETVVAAILGLIRQHVHNRGPMPPAFSG